MSPCLDVLEQFCFLRDPFRFEKLSSRDHDVFAFNVDLEDFEFVSFAEILVEIFDPLVVNLRAWKERFHADVDHEAALDFADDLYL